MTLIAVMVVISLLYRVESTHSESDSQAAFAVPDK